ncbi:MAG: DUF1361 domain-containing protein [Candidatus Sericytochromatia bacterium]
MKSLSNSKTETTVPFRLQELFALTLLLSYSCILLLFRMRYTHTAHYSFLFWNLFLAEIPLVVALVYAVTRRWLPGRLWLGLCLFAWLLFFPNSPYIITDLQHLNIYDEMPKWFDPLLFISSALSGLWAAFYSLRLFETELRQRLGRWPAHGFVAGVWLLTGLGIYLGRVLRWNSWDLFRHPRTLFRDIADPFLNPDGFTQPLGLMLLYGSFFWLSYLFWRGYQKAGPAESPAGPLPG